MIHVPLTDAERAAYTDALSSLGGIWLLDIDDGATRLDGDL